MPTNSLRSGASILRGCLLLAIVVLVPTGYLLGGKSTYAGSSKSGGGTTDSSGSDDQSGGKEGSGKKAGGSEGGGFSIESEMLTYKALESDSEAVACDVAEFLIEDTPTDHTGDTKTDSDFGDAKYVPAYEKPTEADGHQLKRFKNVCGLAISTAQGQRQERWGVIVLASNDPTVGNFQTWRVNMTLMGVLIQRAAAAGCCPKEGTKLCPKPEPCKCEQQGGPEKTEATGAATGSPVVEAAEGSIALIKSAVQLFAVNESISGVKGTVQDQALIDGIARHFRSMAIPVLAPAAYPSFGLEAKLKPSSPTDPSTGYDPEHSPFLTALQKLVGQRICLQTEIEKLSRRISDLTDETGKLEEEIGKLKGQIHKLEAKDNGANRPNDRRGEPKAEQKAAEEKARLAADVSTDENIRSTKKAELEDQKVKRANLQAIASSIDSFVATLFGGTAQKKSGDGAKDNSSDDPSNKDADKDSDGGSEKKKKKSGDDSSSKDESSPQMKPAANAPINAILSADGVIRRLNRYKEECTTAEDGTRNCKCKAPQTGYCDDIYRWQILTVKALESGGGVLTKSSILGSKVYFSGGAVATYALFQLNGDMSCSGNVYDYDGYIREKDFNKKFRNPDIRPDRQMIFYRGRCSAAQSNPEQFKDY